MSLRAVAAADAKAIVEDPNGFAWPITVTSPAGATHVMLGLTKDIAATIDPETGIVVSGRSASVTLSLASLAALGLGMPKNVPEKTSKPWVVQFYDTAGLLHVFKVSDSMPDLTYGIVVCKLEAYKLPTAP